MADIKKTNKAYFREGLVRRTESLFRIKQRPTTVKEGDENHSKGIVVLLTNSLFEGSRCVDVSGSTQVC